MLEPQKNDLALLLQNEVIIDYNLVFIYFKPEILISIANCSFEKGRIV